LINEEIWKVIPRSSGRYFVSNLGNVKSLTYKKERLLKPRVTKFGYLSVSVRINGFLKPRTIHRLVAQAFIDSDCDSRPFVNHKDGNKQNNHINNLEWVSHAENIKHAHDNGLIARNNGAKNGNSKLSETQVLAIKTLINAGFKNKFIANHFCVNPVTVSDIKHKKIWAWLEL
jgi:hypothetical protein